MNRFQEEMVDSAFEQANNLIDDTDGDIMKMLDELEQNLLNLQKKIPV